LHHEFTFTNSTQQPIRLTGTAALTPCCSQVGPVSKEVLPPGGQCQIPVSLKVGAGETGKKRVGSVIQTDSKECPALTYALRATLHPEWEVREPVESFRILSVGRAGRRVMQIVCRRVAGEGSTLPAHVEAESPLIARFLGEPREQAEADGLVSTVRDVEISLPSSSKPGSHHSTIRFRWTDGTTREELLAWEVVPPVRASPSNLILKRAERGIPQSITLRASDGRPFRIIGVAPPSLVTGSEFSQEASATHTLELGIDPDGAARKKDPKITIHLDHPDQATLSLNIFMLPSGD